LKPYDSLLIYNLRLHLYQRPNVLVFQALNQYFKLLLALFVLLH
jgi:hypothetical protein